MQIHEVKRNTANKNSIRVGRGGKRGKTSGKGHKGQNARTGNSNRPEIRDMIKKLPKLRGYRFNSVRADASPVNLSSIESMFDNGAKITPKDLLECGAAKRKGGKIPAIKILATGELTKKVNITGCLFSQAAKEKIEKVGGTIK